MLLDRLSPWYGGLYRGAIVFNFIVAMVAAVGAVVGAHASESWEPAIAVLEAACLVIVTILYLYGRTPRGRPGEDVRRSPWARRWHERWIQYRLLAERFRYASLLQPFEGTTAQRWHRLLASEMPADAPVESLAPIVEQFCRLVTQEASGWNAMLRDKDIPLPH